AILRVGCALRQDPDPKVQPRAGKGKKISNILVILSSSQQDYFKTLVFIKEALKNDRSYVVHVRAHPEIPFDRTLIVKAKAEGLFEIVDSALITELAWADLVIYSSPTTVAWQAVSQGIPVVYINVNAFLDSDMLFNLSSLKWKVAGPTGLIPAIRAIDAITEDDFIPLQKEALLYAKEYFRRVSAEGLDVFTRPAEGENAVEKNKVVMKLAVIVPTKNRPGEIRRLLENVRKQEFQPEQIIIVDGGGIPLDGLLAGFKELRIDYVRMPTSLTEARNLGIRRLKPDITHVGFLDDDIVFDPGCLKSMRDFWENAPAEVGGMGFNISNIAPLEHFNSLKAMFCLSDRRPGALLRSGYETFYSCLQQDIRVDWLFGGAAVWRKEVLEEFKFDEWYKGYAFMEYMDFSYRVSRKKSLVIAAGVKVRHLHAPGERVNGYTFGRMQILNRYYFVKKNPEFSVILFLWASTGRALGIFLIALLYRKKIFLSKFAGNLIGIGEIIKRGIFESICGSSAEVKKCRR
ncbi:MAG: glycosyltransferase, partial [Candidatus Saganbacteria bacterium]|nr:glycosyltransferase [Candidatus Saganbacteria bacterium]